MKTTTPEVRCDACDAVIPTLAKTALFVTVRGPAVGHKKLDFCDPDCAGRFRWATLWDARRRAEATWRDNNL